MRQWTDEDRKRQAENCRQNKPWRLSTGPRTKEGKRKVRMNALKSGDYSAAVNAVKLSLKANREFIKYSYLSLNYFGLTPWRNLTERDRVTIQRLGKSPVQGTKQTELNYFFSGCGYPIDGFMSDRDEKT